MVMVALTKEIALNRIKHKKKVHVTDPKRFGTKTLLLMYSRNFTSGYVVAPYFVITLSF